MSVSVRLKEYLGLLAAQIERAEDRRDVDECQRLSDLCIDVLREYQGKLETARESVMAKAIEGEESA